MNIREIMSDLRLQVAAQQELPARDAVHVPVPEALHADVRNYLNSKFPRGIYSHQALAIQRALEGKDVCLSTSTASGKSLVFMSVAADLLKRERHARVVALYPVRALVQDQLAKWKQMIDPLGFSVGCIDGSVRVQDRDNILLHHRVLLMTPDVAHAWFMSHLGEERVRLVRQNHGLLILDEAHVRAQC